MVSPHQDQEWGAWGFHLFQALRWGVAYCQAVFNENGQAVDFVHLEVNESYERITGLKKIVGLKASEVFPDIESLHPEFIARPLEVARTGVADTFECCFEPMHRCFNISVYSHKQWHLLVIIEDITEHKMAQEALHQSRARVDATIEAAKVGTWDWNFETGDVVINEIWANIIGYSLKELEPISINTWMEHIHPDDLLESSAVFQRHFVGDSDSYSIECRMRHKDGHWVWIQDSGKIVARTSEGKPLRMLGTHIDISRRKQVEENLRKSEEQFRKLFENHTAPMLVIDPRGGNIVNANVAASNFYGWSRDEICRMTIQQINTLPPDRVRAEVMKCESGGQLRFAFSHRTANGSIRDVEVFSNSIPIEGKSRLYSIIHDVSERKRAEEKVESLSRALKATSDCNQVLIHTDDEVALLRKICHIVVDTGGYRMAWVGYAEQDEAKSVSVIAEEGFVEGYNQHRQISWADVPQGRGPVGITIRTGRTCVINNILDDPLFAPWRKEALNHGYSSLLTLPLKAEKTVFGVLTIYSSKADAFEPEETKLLLSLADNLAFGITVLRNRKVTEQITKDREQLQRQLLKAKQDELIRIREEEKRIIADARRTEKAALLLAGDMIAELHKREKLLETALTSERLISEQQRRFLSMISHEYRTPIAIINGNLDILMFSETALSMDYSSELDKMKRAIRRLMEVMDTALDQSRSFDVSTSSVLTRIDIAALVSAQLADVAALWPGRFYHITEEISGAKVIGDPQYLNIAIFNLLDNARKYSPPDSPIQIECRKDGADIVFRVINQSQITTPFISEELFKKYERGSNSANTGGAGIGLWLVRQIIEQYHGTITMESQPQGIVTTVRLPLADEAAD